MDSELELMLSDIFIAGLKSLCDEEGPGAYFSLPLVLDRMAKISRDNSVEKYECAEISRVCVNGSVGYRLLVN